MRKNIYLLLSFALLFCLNVRVVEADETEVKICEYTNSSDDATIYLFASITEKGNFNYRFEPAGDVVKWLKQDLPYGDYFYGMYDNDNLLIDSNISMSAFTCPKYLGLDVWHHAEVCISDNANFCENNNNFLTSYSQEFTLYSSYEDTLKTVYDSYTVGKDKLVEMSDNIREDLLNGSTEEEIVAREKAILESQLSRYMENGELTQFIVNNDIYEKLYNEIIPDTISEIVEEERVKINNNPSYSEEVKNTVNENAENIQSGIYSAFANELDALQGNSFYQRVDCASLLGDTDNPDHTAYWLNLILDIMKYLAIIALVVLSVLDYVTAVTSNDGDAIKKATGKTVKRAIYTVVIFFVPIILNFVLSLVGLTSNCPILTDNNEVINYGE